MCRNLLHFYTPVNGAAEREIKKTIPFITAPRIIRYLGINLTKGVKSQYSVNYITLMKEIEDDRKKWKYIPCSWTGRTNIVKMYYPKQSTILCNTYKLPATFFIELEKKNS